MGVVFDPLYGDVLFHQHQNLNTVIAPASNVLTLTNAAASTLALNITSAKTLTLTAADDYNVTFPATGTVGILSLAQTWTAANHFDVAITNYNSALQDMGVEKTSDVRGYGLAYITDKLLANVLIGSNARTENGGIRVDVTQDPDTLEVYLRSAWNTIIYDLTTEDGDFRHAPLSEQIYVWRGDSVAISLSGQPVIQEYKMSMGAYAPPKVINGGTF